MAAARRNLSLAALMLALVAAAALALPSAMFLTVLSFNIVGDTLRALTDPRPGAL